MAEGTPGTGWTKELGSLQEGLGGLCRGQGEGGGFWWAGSDASSPGGAALGEAMPKRGEVGERQRAVPRRVNVRCCLAASWARASADLFNPIWRGGGGGRREVGKGVGGAFLRLNLVGFSYSRF